MASAPPAQTLVCLGDSITEGKIGASYVERLRAQLPGVRIINAGMNGDTVVHLLRRAERDVIAHAPDVITILVGLNDLTTVYGLRSSRLYYRTLKRLRIAITPPRFLMAYRRLIDTLRTRTQARIALCTLTTVSEDPDEPVQHLIDAYSIIVRGLARQEGLPLIDVRAAFHAALAHEPRVGRPYRIWLPPLDWLSIRVRRSSYDALGARRGYRLLCDGAHLAGGGAALVAEAMLPTLRTLL